MCLISLLKEVNLEGVMKSLGNRIVELRLKQKISQSDLAAILNVSSSTMCRWEKDERNPSIEDIKRMADYFNVSLDYFTQKKKKRIILIFLVIGLVLFAVGVSLFMYFLYTKQHRLVLVEAKDGVDLYGDKTYEIHYILPPKYTDHSIQETEDRKIRELMKDERFRGYSSFSFIYYLSREKYEEDEVYTVSVVCN